MTTRLGALVAVTILAASLCAQTPKRQVSVAGAANLNEVFQLIGPQFEAVTGIHPTFSFGSTAQLTEQIEHGAPYDVFAAADVEHVDQLEKKGLLAPHSRALYARGILALWIPPSARVKPDSLAGLAQASVKIITLAKPELAPYGEAARETLQKAGIWDKVQSKIVYSDNISMAKQYGATGNADAVFTAFSLVMKERGKVIQVDDGMHAPIDQALGIIAASKRRDTAQQFVDFLLGGKGREILGSSGYKLPAPSPRQ